MAIVERRFPVILFGPSGVTQPGTLELIDRLKELKADCLAVTNDQEIAKAAPNSLTLPEVDELLTPIPFIVPAQLFAAYLSEAKGLDPDAPRSLSKVTRTV